MARRLVFMASSHQFRINRTFPQNQWVSRFWRCFSNSSSSFTSHQRTKSTATTGISLATMAGISTSPKMLRSQTLHRSSIDTIFNCFNIVIRYWVNTYAFWNKFPNSSNLVFNTSFLPAMVSMTKEEINT